MTSLTGKTVAITGASSGIGEATARYLAREGAQVVLAARRLDRLETLVADILAEGGTASAVQVDVTRRDDLARLVRHATETHGRLDVLVNNAGLGAAGPMSALLVDEWERMVDVNVKGVLNAIAAALPVFQAQEAGHFVNIASIAGFKVGPGMAVYCGTKFAVRAISEGMRMELGRTIRTTVISPGAVATEFGAHTSHAETSQAMGAFAAIAIAPEAIARAIAYAIAQPAEIDVSEIVVRPAVQDF